MKKMLKFILPVFVSILLTGCEEFSSINSSLINSSSETINNDNESSSDISCEEISSSSCLENDPPSSSEDLIIDVGNNSNRDEIIEILKTRPVKEGFVFAGWFSDQKLTNLITIYSDLEGIEKLYPKWVSITPKTYSVRTTEASVTDSGRRNQRVDEVNLHLDYDYEGLLFAGYNYFEVEVTMSIKEDDDGYQHCLLYSDMNCPNTGTVGYFVTHEVLGKDVDDPSLLCWYTYEHTAGSKNSSWQTYTFKTIININDLVDKIYIRYDASGNFNDTWVNKNVIVKVKPL